MKADMESSRLCAPRRQPEDSVLFFVYASIMDDEYEGWLEGDLLSAIYVALDRLEELDPDCRTEAWFRYLEKAVDMRLAKKIRRED